eukprot:Clim_evm5s26 gene=Clim_evmTU5s26
MSHLLLRTGLPEQASRQVVTATTASSRSRAITTTAVLLNKKKRKKGPRKLPPGAWMRPVKLPHRHVVPTGLFYNVLQAELRLGNTAERKAERTAFKNDPANEADSRFLREAVPVKAFVEGMYNDSVFNRAAEELAKRKTKAQREAELNAKILAASGSGSGSSKKKKKGKGKETDSAGVDAKGKDETVRALLTTVVEQPTGEVWARTLEPLHIARALRYNGISEQLFSQEALSKWRSSTPRNLVVPQSDTLEKELEKLFVPTQMAIADYGTGVTLDRGNLVTASALTQKPTVLMHDQGRNLDDIVVKKGPSLSESDDDLHTVLLFDMDADYVTAEEEETDTSDQINMMTVGEPTKYLPTDRNVGQGYETVYFRHPTARAGSAFSSNHRGLLHWAVCNVKGTDVAGTGVETVPYVPPVPIVGTGWHRVVMLLCKQQGSSKTSADFDELFGTDGDDILDRIGKRTVNLQIDVLDRLQLKPVGAAFAQVLGDESVATSFQQHFGAAPPKFEVTQDEPMQRDSKKYYIHNKTQTGNRAINREKVMRGMAGNFGRFADAKL